MPAACWSACSTGYSLAGAAERWGTELLQSVIPMLVLWRCSAHQETLQGRKGTPVRVSLNIEASQPSGATFRLGLGVTMPLTLILAALRLIGLI